MADHHTTFRVWKRFSALYYRLHATRIQLKVLLMKFLATLGNLWLKLCGWPYSRLFLCFAILTILYLTLVPWRFYQEGENGRAIAIAFLCGALVGITEIASRYRDEQMKAITSPDGLIYILFNGVISTFALILIFHYKHAPAFAALKDNLVAAAMAAGFGATAIMRTRLAVIKGSDNKDISIGPDIVINMLLALIDKRIDRWRAARRVEIVYNHFDKITALGTVDNASQYLLSSLVAFQNLADMDKKQLTDLIQSNKDSKYSVNVQLAAIGFLFLTVVGEENFEGLLTKAKQLKTSEPVPSAVLKTPLVVAPPELP